jgi:hypothetical protein
MRRIHPALLVALAGCAPPAEDSGAPVEPPALVEPGAWRLTPADRDPFTDRPAEAPACSSLGYGPEGSVFEVQTQDCPYGTFSQPLGHALPAGVQVQFDAWHMDLNAPAPAEGHLAVRIGGAVAEIRPAIPGPAAAHALVIDIDKALPEGTPVFLHVHNHGSNAWTLGASSVLPPEEAP